MPTPDSAARLTLGPYLQVVAAALANADATPESVLQAAQALDIDSDVNNARFRAPDSRFRFASVYYSRGADRQLRSVLFVCDEAGAPVKLAELEPAFGTWERTIPGNSIRDNHPVLFDAAYPSPAQATGPHRAQTFVRVSLTADPATPGVRVREILLSRRTTP